MPDGAHDKKRRDTLLRLPVGDLIAWHLVVTCGTCRKERCVSVQPLAEQFGASATLLKLIPKLRCSAKSCRRPPTQVRLRNRFPAQTGGGPFHDVHAAPPFGY